MKVPGSRGETSNATRRGLTIRLGAALLAICVSGTVPAAAGPLISLGSPTDFFTNVATRLLRSELNLDINHLQVYPTNQYTPAVHRLLQVAANLYDSTTNRTFGLGTNYPYFPSVFRPIFRRIESGTNALVFVAGYREVMDASMALPQTAPLMIDRDGSSAPLETIPLYGTPWASSDQTEPMVSGMPLVIGARTGFPSFNELAMQTCVFVSRLLEFRRAPGVLNGPIVQTNQMYVLAVSNVFGLEAWNSYTSTYPRNLQLTAAARIVVTLTNENQDVILSNREDLTTNALVPANTWAGWTSTLSIPASMLLPWGSTNSFSFLTNASYLNQPPWFEPQTHVFQIASNNPFYVPHWWLGLKTRLQFALVDSDANRIVDYVNLGGCDTLDLTSKLADGNTAGVNAGDYRNPANQWITNRVGGLTSTDIPTYGILNQIMLGLNGSTDWLSYTQDPYAGLDAESAVDGFRYNMAGLSPLYPKDAGKVFYRSNIFYAPFDPYRPIYLHTSWQANDPLVHYLISDLLDLSLAPSNRTDFMSHNPPLDNIGRMNTRYQPWGGNPIAFNPATAYQVAIKDPAVWSPAYWDFPASQTLGVDWVGRVHRGTPWQTIFLKSTNILQFPNFGAGLLNWARWTGNGLLRPDWTHPDILVADALYTAPTNDWHLVSLLNGFFNPQDIRQLASPNQASAPAWEALLDNLTVLVNVSSTEIDRQVMSSNSPQAAYIAQAILNERAAQPDQLFRQVGDLLATPELSQSSPWLIPTNAQLITDQVLEIIPSQLLPLLRPDSIGSVELNSDPPNLQFTGFDGYAYAIEVSNNLFDWTTIGTNTAENGLLNFVLPLPAVPARFYRSKLLP